MLSLSKRRREESKTATLGQVTLSRAWVLDFDSGVQAAVGEREMIHLLQAPEIFEIPQAPYYCRHTLIWQGRILPLLDLGAWTAGQSLRRAHTIAGIVRYWEQSTQSISYAALSLSRIPRRVWISDDDACELDEQAGQWQSLVSSCVTISGRPVPILDLPVVFSVGQLSAQ